MRVRYAVTFESNTKPPVTVRGELPEKVDLEEAMKSALFLAFKQKPKRGRWPSVVCVVEQLP